MCGRAIARPHSFLGKQQRKQDLSDRQKTSEAIVLNDTPRNHGSNNFMIRSLVLSANPNEAEIPLRRNLTVESLEAAYEEGATIWIDIVDPEAEEIEWMGRFFKLNPSVISDIGREDRRPSLMVYPAYVFISLFEPQIEGAKVIGREIHCVLGDRFYLTVRHAKAEGMEEAYDRAAQNVGDWQRGLGYFMYLTCQYVIDSYYPLLDRMSNQLSRIEERLLNDGLDKAARKPVYQIRQQLITVRQMIAPQREVLSNILGEQRISSDENRDLFRHLYERLLRVYDLIDAQRDLSNNVLDMIENMESRGLGEAVNRLTIFSMIFLPLTLFTAFFDLGFARTQDEVVLPITGSMMLISVLLLMILSAAGLYLFFKRRGWL
jgi:magnesium transporter